MAIEDQELQNLINELRTLRDQARKAQEDVERADLDHLEKSIEKTKEDIAERRRSLELSQSQHQAELNRIEALKESIQIQERLRDEEGANEEQKRKARLELSKLNVQLDKSTETVRETAAAVREATEEWDEFIKESGKVLKSLQNQQKASKKTQVAISSMTTSILGFRGGLGDAITSLDSMKGALRGVGMAMAKAFSPAGVVDLFGAFAGVLIQAVNDLDQATWQMTTLAGSSEHLQGVMDDLRAETMGTHMEFAELTQNLFAAWSGMSNFSKISEEAQKSLSRQMAMLDKLGLANQDQVKIMQFMNLVIGETMAQSTKTTAELFNMSAASGKGVKELAADFQAASPMLAVYGGKMTSEFRRMAAVSKEAGLEMGKLLGLAGMMDTFEGAAGIAGTLNAFLGGPYLNTVELVGMTEADRLIAIKRSMEAAGQSFSQMSRFKQKGVAKALNMDVAEATALFNSNESAILQRSKAMEISAKREADYKKKIQETMPFMQQLNLLFRDLAMETLAAFAGVGANAKPAELVEGLRKKFYEFKTTLVEDVFPAAKSAFKGFAALMSVGGHLGTVVGALGTALGVTASWLAATKKAAGVMTRAWTIMTPVLKIVSKVFWTIFGALFGIYHVIQGIGTMLTGNFMAGLMQVVGGGLEIGAGALTFVSGGAALGAGLGMSAGGAALVAGGTALADTSPAVNDFIYQGDGTAKRGKITPIHNREQFTMIGHKLGGPAESAGTDDSIMKEVVRLLSVIAGKDTTIKVGEDVLARAVNKSNSSSWGVG